MRGERKVSKAQLQAPDWLYWLTLALIFISPSQYAHAVNPKHGPFIAYADLAAALILLVWAVWLTAARAWRGLTWPPLVTWAVLIVAVVAGAGAESLKLAALEIIQYGLYFVAAFMLFANVLHTEARQRLAVRVLLAATTVVVLYGFVQYVQAGDPKAVTSTFGSRNIYSAFLVITLPLLFGLVMRTDRSWERYWSLAVIVVGALTILSPPLVWVLAIVLTIAAAVYRHRAFLAAYVAGAVAFLVIVTAFVPLNRQVAHELVDPWEQGPIYKIMESTPEAPVSGEAAHIVKKRWIEWWPALNMMAANFFLGVGTGNYQINIGLPEYYGYVPNVKKSEPDTNNFYLVEGCTMGFAGLVALLAFMGHFWRQAAQLWQHAAHRWQWGLAAGLYGSALAIPIVCLFTSPFVRGMALIWALIYALIHVLGRQREMEEHESTGALTTG